MLPFSIFHTLMLIILFLFIFHVIFLLWLIFSNFLLHSYLFKVETLNNHHILLNLMFINNPTLFHHLFILPFLQSLIQLSPYLFQCHRIMLTDILNDQNHVHSSIQYKFYDAINHLFPLFHLILMITQSPQSMYFLIHRYFKFPLNYLNLIQNLQTMGYPITNL